MSPFKINLNNFFICKCIKIGILTGANQNTHKKETKIPKKGIIKTLIKKITKISTKGIIKKDKRQKT